MGGWEPVFTQVYIYIYSIDFINKIIQKIKNNFKIKMLQKIFNNRIEGYLYHGNYDYNPLEANDMLNYKEPLDEIINQIGKYKLYQQQTQGGIYYVLALGYNICE